MVFAHHASYARFDGAWIAPFSGYGHESVVVFFVLSGFVVAYSQENKDPTFRHYAASRLSRLWSVALPTIVLTLILDTVGRALSPAVYSGLCEADILGTLASSLFLNELWFGEACLGTNIPYWSLSYEFFYYCLYGAYAFAPIRWPVLAIVSLLLIGPKVLLLIPCWAAGVAVFRIARKPMQQKTALSLALAGLALFLAFVGNKVGNNFINWRVETLIGSIWAERLGHSTAFISDNLAGAFFSIHLLGMIHLLRSVSISRVKLLVLQRAASATFAIYLVHYPCLLFFTAFCTYLTGKVDGLLVGMMSLVVPILLTPSTEAFKHVLRRQLLAPRANAISSTANDQAIRR